jgi:pimeloyl-ACP methyl ester carboxylesterase
MSGMIRTDKQLCPTAAPEWFRQALENPGVSRYVQVNGCRIHYLAWGWAQDDKPALVFVHGYRAHARWWDFIAPFFARDYRIVALDLSGMGDSGHREHYDPMIYVEDILAVMRDAGMSDATVVGHSFGGGRVLRACVEAPQLIRHAIVIDSFTLFERATHHAPPPPPVVRPYDDLATALPRFRLVPDQPEKLPFIMEYVARHSLREQGGKWVWKFDPALPARALDPEEYKLLGGIMTRVDVLYGEQSAVVSDLLAKRLVETLSNGRGPVEIPQGFHHVMFAQPLALVSTLRALLARP